MSSIFLLCKCVYATTNSLRSKWPKGADCLSGSVGGNVIATVLVRFLDFLRSLWPVGKEIFGCGLFLLLNLCFLILKLNFFCVRVLSTGSLCLEDLKWSQWSSYSPLLTPPASCWSFVVGVLSVLSHILWKSAHLCTDMNDPQRSWWLPLTFHTDFHQR